MKSLIMPVFFYAILASGTALAGLPFTDEFINNGGFETGDLSGWNATDLTVDGPCGTDDNSQDWVVGTDGTFTNCSDPGAPPTGSYAAYNMFDAGTASPLTYRLWQEVDLPLDYISDASLSWQESITWSVVGTEVRVWSVDVYDASGAVLLGNVASTDYGPDSAGSTGWVSIDEDVTALLQPYAGETVIVEFSVYIPETWTGPAGQGLDDVSLEISYVIDTAVPTLSSWGIALMVLALGLVAVNRRRMFIS